MRSGFSKFVGVTLKVLSFFPTIDVKVFRSTHAEIFSGNVRALRLGSFVVRDVSFHEASVINSSRLGQVEQR